MYIIVENNGDYESPITIHECDDFDQLIRVGGRIPSGDVESIYEITRELTEEELAREQTRRARESMQRREAAMSAARAVLTPQQLKDLGLNG